MSTIFYAHGPAFRKGVTLKVFESVNIVPLLAHLLGIIPEPNNGSLSVFKDVLESYKTENQKIQYAPILVIVSAFILTIYFYRRNAVY